MDTFVTIALYLTAIVHCGLVLFVVAGGVIRLHSARVRVGHLVTTLYGFAIAVLQFHCQLTPLENSFRARPGWPQYQGGFVQCYAALILPFQIDSVLFV